MKQYFIQDLDTKEFVDWYSIEIFTTSQLFDISNCKYNTREEAEKDLLKFFKEDLLDRNYQIVEIYSSKFF